MAVALVDISKAMVFIREGKKGFGKNGEGSDGNRELAFIGTLQRAGSTKKIANVNKGFQEVKGGRGEGILVAVELDRASMIAEGEKGEFAESTAGEDAARDGDVIGREVAGREVGVKRVKLGGSVSPIPLVSIGFITLPSQFFYLVKTDGANGLPVGGGSRGRLSRSPPRISRRASTLLGGFYFLGLQPG